MANVAHASMSGSNVHEPKGIETASSGQVYVANGASSGAWATVSGLTFTGMVAPFLTPIAPTGWYELNGATISSTTDAALYNAMTIQGNGTRVSGSAVISGLTSTATFKVGYYVFGTGIAAGTTILSIDSSTDITMSANASSSGTSIVIVSPWQLNTGTITLPDLTTDGRYLRSRTNSIRMGLTQTSQNKSHSHGFTTGAGGAHTHGGTTNNGGVDHTHTGAFVANAAGTSGANNLTTTTNPATANTSGASAYLHTHTFTTGSADYGGGATTHVHTGTTDTDGSTETRPETLVVMWCVKR